MKTSAPQVEPAQEDEVLLVEPAHVMKREKHLAREHYEALAREAAGQK